MSELSRAISRLRIFNIPGNPGLRKQLKDAFRAGWEEREELLNKRVAEIEKAATLKERERCAALCNDMVLYNGYDCAEAIRSGK